MFTLLLTIRFHDGRYYGVPDWPPSPARVFQALVSAAARGRTISRDAKSALEWLETLGAPIIAAPVAREAKGFSNFVPNNDLDAVGGDVRRIGEIRTPKVIHPHLFDAGTPLYYAWEFEGICEDRKHAGAIIEIAQGLYQLGRGVDMAYADGKVLTLEGAALDDRLREEGQHIWRPAREATVGGTPLACPMKDSLASLIDRHRQTGKRFTTVFEPAPPKKERDKQKAVGQIFRQPPKPRFRQVAYDSPAIYLSFDIVRTDEKGEARFAPQPLSGAVALVTCIRDAAANRLRSALPQQSAAIDRIFIGRGAAEADKAQRLKIIPLPSIGFALADRAIRRIVIEIPPNCPFIHGDIEWAFSGLILTFDPETGEIPEIERSVILARSTDDKMLGHYGLSHGAGEAKSVRIWRTVTPAALPAARRRIDPKRIREEAKGGTERAEEEVLAAGAVLQALRHAGLWSPVEAIRVQREPFEAKGVRAEAFAYGRFDKHRLWHAEIAFETPKGGAILIGDGRYLGLGLMAPIEAPPATIFEFSIIGERLPVESQRVQFLRAVRRALMAIDRDCGGGGNVSRLFSGHEDDGSPARSGTHEHVFLAATAEGGQLSRLFVLSPALADRRAKLSGSAQLRFAEVVQRLELVRAGELGAFNLVEANPHERNILLNCAAREWVSETAYRPTRHIKSNDDPVDWLAQDVFQECARRGFPRPEIEMVSFEMSKNSRPNAYLKLVFQVPIRGPILIGHGSHFGCGLFLSRNI